MPREKMTQKQIADYRNGYARDHYDNIRVQALKADQLPERLAAAVQAGKADSKQAYIIQAVKDRLSKDGF